MNSVAEQMKRANATVLEVGNGFARSSRRYVCRVIRFVQVVAGVYI